MRRVEREHLGELRATSQKVGGIAIGGYAIKPVFATESVCMYPAHMIQCNIFHSQLLSASLIIVVPTHHVVSILSGLGFKELELF